MSPVALTRREAPTPTPRLADVPWAPPAPRTAAFGFPVEPVTPRRARRRTVEFAHRCGLGGLRDAAELVVSELMTNAYEASCSASALQIPASGPPPAPLELRLAAEAGRLRIEVRDHDPRPPLPSDPPPERERGRGLRLVEAFSECWGYDRLPGGGKAVWCIVASPSGEPTR